MKIMSPHFLGSTVLALWLASSGMSFGQAVAVTAQLDSNSIAVGGTTTLRVFAQVVPGLRSTSDRIFSWYLDVNNTNAAAAANYAAMLKPASDNDPFVSSTGFTQGANRRGIYDTFMNRPGAGVNDAVELMRIPITGVAAGQTRFSISAGTGVPQLEADFFVAPIGGGDPYLGGLYTGAVVDLQVTGGSACNPVLQISRLPNGTQALISFTPCSGRTHTVEGLTAIDGVATWQALPGAPHNSGSVTVNLSGPQRFFRVRVTNP